MKKIQKKITILILGLSLMIPDVQLQEKQYSNSGNSQDEFWRAARDEGLTSTNSMTSGKDKVRVCFQSLPNTSQV